MKSRGWCIRTRINSIMRGKADASSSHAVLKSNNRLLFSFQLSVEGEEFICQALRESARMVSHSDDDFIDCLLVHNAILFGGDDFTADSGDNHCIGRARKQFASHRSIPQNSSRAQRNECRSTAVLQMDGGKLSESVQSVVAMRDLAVDLPRRHYCQFAVGTIGER